MPFKKEDLFLYQLIREKSENFSRNELYYAVLDWADKHEELRKELCRFNDKYTVKIIDKDNKCAEYTFTQKNSENPYFSAKNKYSELCEKGAEIAELWLEPNSYRSGPDRIGRLINSHEIVHLKNERKKEE